jgi:uncharacterized protein DUF6636
LYVGIEALTVVRIRRFERVVLQAPATLPPVKRLIPLVAVLSVLLGSVATMAAATRLPGFHSPSGNISCLALPGGRTILCTLGRAGYSSRLQDRCMAPGGAGVDWHGFTLSATGKGQLNCSGGILYNPDTQKPSYVTLPYGKSWRQGPFTCTSRLSGVTCRNRAGHRLFVSRQSWRLW